MELIKAGTLKSLISQRNKSSNPLNDDEASEIMKFIFKAV